MRAMVLDRPGQPLRLETRPMPEPGPGELRLRVLACAVCRTDLHIADGELAVPSFPVVPGHEIVGLVDLFGPPGPGSTSTDPLGADGQPLHLGQRVGLPWLAHSCGHCAFCHSAHENLCDAALFTGHGRDGGFASHVIANAAFCLPLGEHADALHTAPLLCAGLIGWRALRLVGDDAHRIGLYGFGVAAHLVAQVLHQQGREVCAFTRAGDVDAQVFARSLGAAWAGASDQAPPVALDAALIFAPVGALVPLALRAVRKGGRVVCAGIHMSDIPQFPYALLWQERQLLSVANLTRADGLEFLRHEEDVPLQVHATPYALDQANAALDDLRAGRLQGAAVLVP